MKIKAVRSKLLAGIAAVKTVAKGEDEANPFRNVKVETMGSDCVLLTASNGDQQITSRVMCEVMEEGAAALVANRLARFVGGLPEGEVSISDSSVSRVAIEGGQTRFTLAKSPAEDFPLMKGPEEGAAVVYLDTAKLLDLVRKTRYAVCQDKTRAVLGGVHVWTDAEERRIGFVATDGKRLSTHEAALGDQYEVEARGATIPSAAVADIERLAAKWPEGEVRIELGSSAVRLTGGLWGVTAKVIDQPYPPWRRAIPPDDDRIEVGAEREVLLDAIRTAALSTWGDARCVRLSFAEDAVRVEAKSGISGSVARAPVKYRGEPFSVSLDPDLVEDALGCLSSGGVRLTFGKGVGPVVVLADDEKEVAFTGVVMPLREGV